MKAPDKIYIAQLWEKPSIEQTGFSPVWSDEVRPAFNNIAYIRKEALLKWARAKHMELDPPQNERDFGRIEAVEELIDKINSL